MFELTTKGSDGWKTIMELAFSLNEEAVIDVTEKGLDFKIMDIDKSGLVDFVWEPSEMVNFKCGSEQKIGIRTEDFKKILGRASNQDISINHGGDSSMEIKIGDSKTYNMQLVNTDLITTGSSPKVVYDNTIHVPYSVLKEKVGDLLIVGHFMKLKVETGMISFSATGDGAYKGTTVYKDESIKVDKPMEGSFSLSHLDNALKAVSKVDEIVLSIQDNYPLCMTIELPDVGKIKYYLAPYRGSS